MNCLHCMSRIPDGSLLCPVCGKSLHFENQPHQLTPGTILAGKYLVGEAIGEGGFGITYIGLDLYLNLRLAIKEFFPFGFATRNHGAGNQITWSRQTKEIWFREGVDRFLMEARSIAQFHGDPNIVEVKNFFQENNTAYIVMEYLDGMNLSRRVSTCGPLKADDAFRLFLPVMYSLERMHRAGVLHRDIAPNNVRLLSGGSLKIMDFGSARYYGGGRDRSLSVLYKEGYSPLEQRMTKGEQGPWTDIYSLCATLYFCITGKVPEDALNRLHADGLVKPSALGVPISPSLEKILLHGLAVNPGDRYRDMAELIQATEMALAKEEEKEGKKERRNQGARRGKEPALDGGGQIDKPGEKKGGRKPFYTVLGLGLGIGLVLIGLFL
ncbi:MAG: serine/threonine protein kinase, partial [Blautia sp.]|nr:serine/threonine protein kinase [Blautia sp.]